MLKISTNPHMQTSRNTKSLMLDVVIALMPAAVAAVLFFGLDALRVILTSVAGCVMFEYLACRYWLKIKNTTSDYSAIITGLLLAYNLPSTMPCWMILIGSFVAIIIAKVCFGGLGCNIFNPALVGRVFLFISFPVQMTVWPNPHFLSLFSPDGSTGATTLRMLKSMNNSGEISAEMYTIDFGSVGVTWKSIVCFSNTKDGHFSIHKITNNMCVIAGACFYNSENEWDEAFGIFPDQRNTYRASYSISGNSITFTNAEYDGTSNGFDTPDTFKSMVKQVSTDVNDYFTDQYKLDKITVCV